MKKTRIIIKTNDPEEAEYIAKVLINDAHDRKMSASCTKLFNELFGIEHKKEVKIKDDARRTVSHRKSQD